MPIAVFADDIYTDGTNNYTTFVEAINGCTTCNIKLLADVNKNEIEIPAGKIVNLDLNGKTVSSDAITCTSCTDIVNNGTLNVSNGTLADAKDGSYTANKYGIVNNINGVVTVKNVNFSFTGAVNSAAVINSGNNNNTGNITPASDTDPIENPNTGMFIGIGAILIGVITLLTLGLKKKFYRI